MGRMASTVSLSDRLSGGIYGLLIGDAVGVPYEFHRPESLPAEIDMVPPVGFPRAHRGVQPGTWSDDGAHALCLLHSLLEHERLVPDALGRELLDWYDSGHFAVGGQVFDVGVQTTNALRALRSGVPAVDAGPSRVNENGNGSLMRVLPLALWHKGTDVELANDAMLQSRVTHGHERAQVCCALYCVWARRLLEGRENAWDDAVTMMRGFLKPGSEAEDALESHIRPEEVRGGGSGYVVDTLMSARWAMSRKGYSDVVLAAIGLGNDTDTTACVAGGVAGVREGVGGIPEAWLSGLRGREMVEPLLAGLLKRRGV